MVVVEDAVAARVTATMAAAAMRPVRAWVRPRARRAVAWPWRAVSYLRLAARRDGKSAGARLESLALPGW